MDRIVELKTLVLIHETGSFAGAASRLNRAPSAVTRIVSDLEARLGVALFERSPRRCRATDAGIRFIERARDIIAGYDEAIDELAGVKAAPAGNVRLSAPLLLGRDHLAPCLAAFMHRFPAITIDLQLADRVVDLVEENFDIAVRVGPIAVAEASSRPIGEVVRYTLASPAYLEANGQPQTPEDLAAHTIVDHMSHDEAPRWHYIDPLGIPRNVRVRPRIVVNQTDAALSLARSGFGIATALSYQVSEDLRTGQLVRILKSFESPPKRVSLVYLQSRQKLRRVQLLVDHIARHLNGIGLDTRPQETRLGA